MNKSVPELTSSVNGSIMAMKKTEQKLRECIKTNSLNKTVTHEKQSRHIRNPAGYIIGKNLYIGRDRSRSGLDNKYHRIGIPNYRRRGECL